MSWFERFFSSPPELTPEQTTRLDAWKALPAADADQSVATGRFVVVDVESSGLDPRRDQLIAIGAVAVVDSQIRIQDSFEIVLQQAQASARDNILIHGIGGTVQREGVPPDEALITFLEFVGKDPLIAFHVAFDQKMINRALKACLGLRLEHPWLDLAFLAPALEPRIARHTRTLDDWMARFGIGNYARHSALADALATAELFLALRPLLAARKATSFRDMKMLEAGWQRQLHA